MTSSWRTYRSLRVLVAFALLLGVSAPLVHHVCAMTGEAMAASHVAEMPHASDHAVVPCVHDDHEDGHHVLCVDGQQAPPGCEMAPCTFEASEQVLAISAEGPSVRLNFVPALITERVSPVVFFSSRPVFQWGDEITGARDLVPVRLLTSTFLL